jgi:flavodoxin
MKSIVIYYSYSGNTKKVADILVEYLAQQGEVNTIELKAQDESGNFFTQCSRAFWRKRAKIEPINFDLLQFDLICLGTPVWAFGPAPTINTFLDQCAGLENKKVILFTTYGSGTGNGRCLKFMQDILSNKGASNFNRFSIQQFKVNDREFVLAKIKDARLPPLDLTG